MSAEKETAATAPQPSALAPIRGEGENAPEARFPEEKIVYEPPERAANSEKETLAPGNAMPSPASTAAVPSPGMASQSTHTDQYVADTKIAAETEEPAAPGYSSTPAMTTEAPQGGFRTVTPLHLLQDQPDRIDCSFCQRQAITEIKKVPSQCTHVWGGVCFFIGIFVGAAIPYLCGWSYDVEHYCTNCHRKVATRRTAAHETEVYGTPEHLREVSRFPAAQEA
ncbi:hypothetical protein GQ53DRAFT_743183 [Thozetella sp. PMI_491]|nr:hypothetical protein GQ53DRAFT_743183 [Thozetella sp. PMI_491]